MTDFVARSASTPEETNSSANVVSGSENPRNPVMNFFSDRLPTAAEIRERLFQVWSNSQPWNEFLNTSQMNLPPFSELKDRLQQNLTHYGHNYAVILLVLSGITVLVSPFAILGLIMIFAAYLYLFVFHADALVFGNLQLDNRAKSIFLLVFSLLLLGLTGAGATFTSLVAVVALIAFIHATVRKPPGEADFETAYTPAVV
ncbi:prenylated Rab receptor 2 [Galdieria sulphuraria]|uniref:PRA1 family protein n=1 Tax=Galdieria sulphuraria TaxID=130081 RepID=M2XSH0_GALSU|nr:prenylated Rab receptor 2 [Galdieria sulphuraria]EME26628.1 prenylated Rab receptor 2 [Galdieria sulphuraria]|eukprot:XP_005703148.1 prenylated Rab receptor 2 [Galdieria sulphuraria]